MDKEAIMKAQLEAGNAWLGGKLKESEFQLETMANLSLESIHCSILENYYSFYLKEQWLQFQIKALA